MTPDVIYPDVVLRPDDDQSELTDLLVGPSAAATRQDVMPPVPGWQPPWMPRDSAGDLEDDENDPGERLPSITVVSEFALHELVRAGLVVLEAAVFKTHEHPRWPQGTPGGKGGEFMAVGQTFLSGGKKWQISQIVKGHIYAHEASGAYDAVETKSFDVKQENGQATVPGIEYAKPTLPVGGKSGSTVTIVDPYVDPATHDPSIPVPEGSALSPEQWQRFGRIDQEHYTELMERFGQHKPGKAKQLIDASYAGYQDAVQNMVKHGYQSQYGSSSGFSLSLLAKKLFHKSDDEAAAREQALALQAEHKAAVQWDLYNRTLSPDVTLFHRDSQWSASDWHKKLIVGDTPAFSGLSQSYSFGITQFGSHGIMTPLAIRHVLLASKVAQPVPGQTHFPGELEIATAEQLKLDHRTRPFSEGGYGTSQWTLTPVQSKWLHGVTQQPQGGELMDMLLDSINNGTKLPIPPAKPSITMDGAGGKTWVDPPADAGTVLPAEKLPSVQSQNIDPTTLDKSLPWTHVTDDGTPEAVSGHDAGAKEGQFFMGLKGTLYWIGPDPGVSGGAPFRIHKIVGGEFNGENFAYDPKLPGYYLDAGFELPKAKEADQTFNEADWVNGIEPEFLEDFQPGDKFKLNGTVYEVTGKGLGGHMNIKDLESGKTGNINGDYKSLKLVPKGSAGAEPENPFTTAPLVEGDEVVTPEGHGTVAAVDDDTVTVAVTATGQEQQFSKYDVDPWASPLQPKPGLTLPIRHPDDPPGSDKSKAVVTKVLADGSVQVNFKPGKMVIPADEWASYAASAFDPSAHAISGEKVKLRGMKPGDRFQASAGNETLRPYEVLSVPAQGKVTVRNMDTGVTSTMSRHVSYRPLVAKPEPGSAAAGQQDTPDSPAATPNTPVSTSIPTNINPADYESSGLHVPPEAWEVGMVVGPGKPTAVVVGKDADGTLHLQALHADTPVTFEPAELSLLNDLSPWQLKGDKPEGDLTADPPAAPEQPYVQLDQGKFIEGDLMKLADMAPGTVFKTNGKNGAKFYKISDDGQYSVALSNGKSFPLKGGWKATVLHPAERKPAAVDADVKTVGELTWKAGDKFVSQGNAQVPDGSVLTAVEDKAAPGGGGKFEDAQTGELHTLFNGHHVVALADSQVFSAGEPVFLPDGSPVVKGQQYKSGPYHTVTALGSSNAPGGVKVQYDDGSTGDLLPSELEPLTGDHEAPEPAHKVGDTVTIHSEDSFDGMTGEVIAVQPQEGGEFHYKVKPEGASALMFIGDELEGADGKTDAPPTPPTPGKVTAGSLKTKPGALFVHQQATMSIAADQSLATKNGVVAIGPDGKTWHIADIDPVSTLPGTGATAPHTPGTQVVYGLDPFEIVSVSPNPTPDDKPGGHVVIKDASGTTSEVPASLLTNLQTGDLHPGDKVLASYVNAVGDKQETVGHLKQILPNGDAMLFGDPPKTYKATQIKPLKSYPYQEGDQVKTKSGVTGTFDGFAMSELGEGLKALIDVSGNQDLYEFPPDEVGLADSEVPDQVGVPLTPKADVQIPYDDLVPGDVTTVKALQAGDQFSLPGSDSLFQVVKPPPDSLTHATVQQAFSDGSLSATELTAGWTPDTPVVLSAKADAAAKMPPASPGGVDWDLLPDAVEQAGFVGYKSHKGSGGKWSHHMVKTMPEGTIFADLSGKQWKVKQAGAKPVITDGESLFRVNGNLRGKDLNQPAVTATATLVDNSPSLSAQVGVPDPNSFVPNVQGLTVQQLGLKVGDTFQRNHWGALSTYTVEDTHDPKWFQVSDEDGAIITLSTLTKPSHVQPHVLAAAGGGSALAGPKVQTPDGVGTQTGHAGPWVEVTDGAGNASVHPPATVTPAPEQESSASAPDADAAPTLFTQNTPMSDLAVGQKFALSPGSSQVFTVTGKDGGGVQYEDEAGHKFGLLPHYSLGLWTEPAPPSPPAAPPTTQKVKLQGVGWHPAKSWGDFEVGDTAVFNGGVTHEVVGKSQEGPWTFLTLKDDKGKVWPPRKHKSTTLMGWDKPQTQETSQPVDPATIAAIDTPDEFGPAADVLVDPVIEPTPPQADDATAPEPTPGALQPFSSRLGPGGVYRHDRLAELQPGQMFTDKTGEDYQLVAHGEGVATFKHVKSGKVYAAPNGQRVKRTALPPDPGPGVKAVLSDLVAKYGSLENVPTAQLNGYTSATGEGGKVKYPRLGHLKTGDWVLDADGEAVLFVASWLDKALVSMPGGYRIVDAATRVRRSGQTA